MQVITATPTQAIKCLLGAISASEPVIIWGPPGVGKSDMVRQVAASDSRELRDVRAVQLDPVDLRGLPYIDHGVSRWAIPDFLPQTGRGLLFLDEINRSAAMVQNACLQLILDRRLGDYKLPDGWEIVAACNRESDGGGVTKMTSALTSRFTHIEVEPDLDDWCRWADLNGVSLALISFLRWRPELLHQFDRNERSFPCPRTWAKVNRILAQKLDSDIEYLLIVGLVGQAAAVQFAAFQRVYKSLPNLDSILLNPSSESIPTDSAVLYALSVGLGRKANCNNLGRVMTYLDRLPSEFSVLAIKDAVKRDLTLKATPEFTKWSVRNSSVIF